MFYIACFSPGLACVVLTLIVRRVHKAGFTYMMATSRLFFIKIMFISLAATTINVFRGISSKFQTGLVLCYWSVQNVVHVVFSANQIQN